LPNKIITPSNLIQILDITISNGQLTATINPKGAELNSLKNAANTEFIWEGDAKYWGKHSPILFPIVGTLKNNSYLYNGQVHALTRHGFARDNMFAIKEQTENSVTFSLSQNEDTLRVYPFKFELQLAYILKDKALHLNYTVINNGTGKMPFSIGAHPAFALPGAFDDYSLKFEKTENLISTMLEDDLLSDQVTTIPTSNGTLPLNYSLFENDALIFKSLQSKEVTIAKDGNDYIKVSFVDFPHLGIWTKEDAPFLCIEPWQGYSDSPETRGNLIEKEGVVLLEEGESYKASFAIEIIA
jgi:galactose mutarotase-like enzyme